MITLHGKCDCVEATGLLGFPVSRAMKIHLLKAANHCLPIHLSGCLI